MNQFRTAFIGGYRKEEVDERLKDMAEMIEQMKKDAESREQLLKSNFEEEKRKIFDANVQYENELNALKARLAEKDAAIEKASEKLSQLDISIKNQQTESINTQELKEQIAKLETEHIRKEAEYQNQINELHERLRQQENSCDAAARVLAIAEREAEAMVADARARAILCEQKAVANIDAKRMAAVRAMEDAQSQIVLYLESFKRTQEKLSETYEELGVLVEKMPEGLSDIVRDTAINVDTEKRISGWQY